MVLVYEVVGRFGLLVGLIGFGFWGLVVCGLRFLGAGRLCVGCCALGWWVWF